LKAGPKSCGVSKYKERRRETENRLKDTRENLTRVDDILRELNNNLSKLQGQAEVAQQYRTLQDAGTLKLHQLWFLKSRDAAAEETRAKAAAAEASTALEARVAELRHVEAEMEAVRQSHYKANDELHVKQGFLAEAALEVSRLEERIRYVVEGRNRAQAREAELKVQNAQWAERESAARLELGTIAAQIESADEQAAVLAARAEEQGHTLPTLEEAVRAAQNTANQQRGTVAQVQQQIQVLAAESRSVEEQQRALKGRREKLGSERQALQAPDGSKLDGLKADEAAAAQAQQVADARLHELQDQVPTLDEQRRAAQLAVNSESGRLADIAAKLEALRALQAKVQIEGKLKPWLEKHGLAGLPGLWKQVHIEAGWEAALESVLRERLNALAVGKLDTVRAFAGDAPPAKLAFYALPSLAAGASSAGAHNLPLLLDKLQLGDASLKALLADWLAGVFTATSMEDALAQRDKLAHGEIIITREGHAVSAHAVSFYAPDSEQAGMLARGQEIESLDRQQRAQVLLSDTSKTASVRLEAAYTEASQRLQVARRDAADAQTRFHGLHVELLRLTQQLDAATSRHGQLSEELAEIEAQLEALEERKAVGEARFEELDVQLGTTQERHAELDDAVIAADRQLNDGREQQRTLERQAQEAKFQARAAAARRDELARSIETAAAQVAANLQAGEQLQLELGAFDDAAAQSGLQAALVLKLERENHLGLARSLYDDYSAQLRRAEEQKMSFERSLDPLREQITKLQLELQAAQLGGAQYIEQLGAAEVDLEALVKSIEDGNVKLWGLQTEIDRIQKEINALGAVNLAALDELTSASERKVFLDAQNADLQEAMQTLEDAIQKIDLETRDLLGSTFNKVNEQFGIMFPKLFGGGHAKLMMTGTEILDSGVQVQAQPPGKKNSTIHLLSGGEKALTAIALVFAIFMLNPAPFCLLDEVDAPLDDANTERYRKLVTEMSAGTQFLFISHNKIAMEMAEQLIGVTMQEQGVSRIVAVDMEAAVSMAEAA
jgi:chromosome segregation protein